MNLSPKKLNQYLFFKLPSAYWSGVRVQVLESEKCEVKVRYKWFNQNPFKSMYFAVQAMAAELSTGALVMKAIAESNSRISMLVANNKSTFTKKAVGKIIFTCNDGKIAKEAIAKAIATKEGQKFWMTSIGINEKGEQVSEMSFEWTVKSK